MYCRNKHDNKFINILELLVVCSIVGPWTIGEEFAYDIVLSAPGGTLNFMIVDRGEPSSRIAIDLPTALSSWCRVKCKVTVERRIQFRG